MFDGNMSSGNACAFDSMNRTCGATYQLVRVSRNKLEVVATYYYGTLFS